MCHRLRRRGLPGPTKKAWPRYRGHRPPEPAGRPAADLEAQLRTVVTEALAPLSARLARLEEARRRPGLRDILGGLGYILGLVGVGAYLQARRLRERNGGAAASGRAP